MSDRNFLEKLLNGAAVEWKALGELAKIYDGTHQTPKYTSSGVPFVSVENIQNLYTTKKFISVDDFEKYTAFPHNNRYDIMVLTSHLNYTHDCLLRRFS